MTLIEKYYVTAWILGLSVGVGSALLTFAALTFWSMKPAKPKWRVRVHVPDSLANGDGQ